MNSLNPGMIVTEGVQAAGLIGSDFEKEAVQRTPLGRIGQPQDVATIAAFLASDESGWVNGQTIQAAADCRLVTAILRCPILSLEFATGKMARAGFQASFSASRICCLRSTPQR